MMVVLTWALPLRTEEASQRKPTSASASGKARQNLPPPAVKQDSSAPPISAQPTPAAPPNVTYLDGQLTIVAENSSLADILSAVSRQTGAVIELPPGSGSDRVASRMGPGPARDVLAALLNGSRFDYVMTGSLSNPAGVERIILIPRGNGPESTTATGIPAIANNVAGQQSAEQNATRIGSIQQPSPQDATEAQPTPDSAGVAWPDDSDQPMRVWTSEGVPAQVDGAQQPQPSGQQGTAWPQAFPRQPASGSQQPANSPTTANGSPTSPPSHN